MNIVEKWSALEVDKIQNDWIRKSTALVLDNCLKPVREATPLTESFNGIVSSLGSMQGSTPGALGSTTDFSATDSRMPTVIAPLVRRFFPELIAHELTGVQPMSGPVGFAWAVRAKYGRNALGKAGGTDYYGEESGYRTIHADHSGTSGLTAQNNTSNFGANIPGVGALDPSNDMWQAYAGNTTNSFDGMGQSLSASEWLKVGEDMPMMEMGLEKGVVTAMTRKLASNWSLELAEDLMNMNNLNVDSEMLRILSNEIKTQTDRHVLSHVVKATINGGALTTSTWSPTSADGRNQIERIGDLYTHILIKSQRVAELSRRGAANKAVVSPTVAALLQRLHDMAGFMGNTASGTFLNTQSEGGVSKIGKLLQGNMDVFRDTFAGNNYVLLVHKGATPFDSGVQYCPYIPMEIMRAQNPQTFNPVLGIRSRYGILDHLFGSAYFQQFIKIDGLTQTALQADGGRVFTQI